MGSNIDYRTVYDLEEEIRGLEIEIASILAQSTQLSKRYHKLINQMSEACERLDDVRDERLRDED